MGRYQLEIQVCFVLVLQRNSDKELQALSCLTDVDCPDRCRTVTLFSTRKFYWLMSLVSSDLTFHFLPADHITHLGFDLDSKEKGAFLWQLLHSPPQSMCMSSAHLDVIVGSVSHWNTLPHMTVGPRRRPSNDCPFCQNVGNKDIRRPCKNWMQKRKKKKGKWGGGGGGGGGARKGGRRRGRKQIEKWCLYPSKSRAGVAVVAENVLAAVTCVFMQAPSTALWTFHPSGAHSTVLRYSSQLARFSRIAASVA